MVIGGQKKLQMQQQPAGPQSIGQQQVSNGNVQRLLNTKGQTNDPLAEELLNENSSNTEIIGADQQSDDFMEEEDQYMVTRQHGDQRSQGQYLSKGSTQLVDKMSEQRIADDQESSNMRYVAGGAKLSNQPTIEVNSNTVMNNDDITPQQMYQLPVMGKMSIDSQYNDGRHAGSGVQQLQQMTYPASAGVRTDGLHLINPISPATDQQTLDKAQTSSFIHEEVNDSGAQNQTKAFVILNQDQDASQKAFPVTQNDGSNIEQQHENHQFHIEKPRNTEPSMTSQQQLPLQFTQVQAQSEHQAALHGTKSSRSRTNSDGQATVIVPNVAPDSAEIRINEKQDETQHLSQNKQPTLDALMTAQIVTGEAQVSPNMVEQSMITPKIADDLDIAHRRLLTDSQPIVVQQPAGAQVSATNLQQSAEVLEQVPEQAPEQVQSAEFAMSTFNILNNKQDMTASSELPRTINGAENAEATNMVAGGEALSENENVTDTRIAAPVAVSTSIVQKQHILSGTRELKQFNSVLTGHVADTASNPSAPLIDPSQTVNKSKTVMNYAAAADADSTEMIADSKPNRLLKPPALPDIQST